MPRIHIQLYGIPEPFKGILLMGTYNVSASATTLFATALGRIVYWIPESCRHLITSGEDNGIGVTQT